MKENVKPKGFGLIEVLIAVAVIAAAALLVSQFVSSQTNQQIRIRNASDCQTGLNALIAEIKTLDNNTQVDAWMPVAGQMSPNSTDRYLQTRVTESMAVGFPNSVPGQLLASVDPEMNDYTVAERELARSLNTYQLIYSASSLLAPYYNGEAGTFCGTFATINRSGTNYLEELIETMIDEETTIEAQLVRIDLSSGTDLPGCTPWVPLPVNASSTANSNSTVGLKLTLRGTYIDETNQQKNCTANATISPGSDLTAPAVNVTEVVEDVTAHANVATNNLYCGTSTSEPTIRYTINQNSGVADPGIQYLCRLDYQRGGYSLVTNPAEPWEVSSGWFFCSMPEAPLRALSINGTNLDVDDVVVTPGTDTVSFRVLNVSEGAYKLHVKAVDTARNESAIDTSIVVIDVSRPRFRVPPAGNPYDLPAGRVANSPNSNLNGYNFQCSNQLHTDWTVHVDPTAEVEISDTRIIHSYYAQATMPGPTPLTCATATNLYSGMNGTNTAWLDDGPKTAEFIICDECNITLNVAPERQDALWFVDTANALVGNTPNLSGQAFATDGGDNHLNPYVISAPQLNAINASTAQVNLPPSITTTYPVRNSYVGRVRTGAITPPVQPINACLPYGRYGYEMYDGCYNSANPALTPSRVTTIAPYVYNNTDGASNLCGGAGLADNFRYCPTFVVAPGTYAPMACTAPEVTCDIQVDQGYCGFRGPTTCAFKTGINRACAQPPGCELTNYNGGSLSLPVGNTEYSYITSVRGGGGDPCACEQGDFSCRDFGGSARFVQSVGNAIFSGGVWTCGAGQLRDGLRCYQEMPLNTPIFVSCEPAAPASCTPASSCADLGLASCAGCTNGGVGSCYDADSGAGVMCCGTAATCPSGTTECTAGSPGCPAAPNGDGLYCAPNSCTGTWGYVGACNETHSCAPTETPTSITQTQTCSNADCCGTAESRTCYTGCASGPTCSHDGNTYEGGQTVQTYASSTVACGSSCTPQVSTCVVSGGTASWSPALLAADSCSVDACPVNGQCGGANGGSFVDPPASDLCAEGTPTAVGGGGPYSWSCQGSGAGASNASCSANRSCLFHTDTGWNADGNRCDMIGGAQTTVEHGAEVSLTAHLCTGGIFTNVAADGSATFRCNQGGMTELPGSTCLCQDPE